MQIKEVIVCNISTVCNRVLIMSRLTTFANPDPALANGIPDDPRDVGHFQRSDVGVLGHKDRGQRKRHYNKINGRGERANDHRRVGI